MSGDFRLNNYNDYELFYETKHKSEDLQKKFVYGLSEFYRNEISKSKFIANPGCYPTSILLPLIPLIKDKQIKSNNIIIDSKSGYSGAGRGVHKKYKYQNLYDSLKAYGVGFHRHNSEIEQTLKEYSNKKIEFNFTPHLTPMFRGILSTIYVEVNKNVSQNKIKKVLTDYYKNDIFIKILKNDSFISTNDVINTNRCHISVCKTKNKNKFIILSIIDNLIKGGSGQGVQNMNLKFGFPLTTGLI